MLTIGGFVAQSVCIEATIVKIVRAWVQFPPQAMSLHKSKTFLRTVSDISQ
jgi:hypothetical protein